MYRFICLCILSLSFSSAYAKAGLTGNWTLNGSKDDIPTDLISTSDGGFLITATVSSVDGDFINRSGITGKSVYAAKFNSCGTKTWDLNIYENNISTSVGAVQNSDGSYTILVQGNKLVKVSAIGTIDTIFSFNSTQLNTNSAFDKGIGITSGGDWIIYGSSHVASISNTGGVNWVSLSDISTSGMLKNMAVGQYGLYLMGERYIKLGPTYSVLGITVSSISSSSGVWGATSVHSKGLGEYSAHIGLDIIGNGTWFGQYIDRTPTLQSEHMGAGVGTPGEMSHFISTSKGLVYAGKGIKFIGPNWSADFTEFGFNNELVELAELSNGEIVAISSVTYGSANHGIRILKIKPESSSEIIKSCGKYTWKGITYDKDGYFPYDTTLSSAGCDSIIWKQLSLYTPIEHQISVDTCTVHESIQYKSHTLYNDTVIRDTLVSKVTQCDSIDITSITIRRLQSEKNVFACGSYQFRGQTFTNTVTVQDTLSSSLGCDSIASTNIIITPIITAGITNSFDQDSICFDPLGKSCTNNFNNNLFRNSPAYPDKFEWISTRSGTFGPTSDHTSGSGKFAGITMPSSSTVGDTVGILMANCIDLTSATSASLNFWRYIYSISYVSPYYGINEFGGTFEIHINREGLPSVLLKRIIAQNGSTNAWVNETFDLSPYLGQVIGISFVARAGDHYTPTFGIDDIELSIQEMVTSVQNQNSININIHPNPTSGLVQLQSSSPITYFHVSSIDGAAILQQTGPANQIDVSNLASGIYLVTVEFEDGSVVSKRLVKQ